MSPVIEEFMFFHDYLLLTLIFITVKVGVVMFGLGLKRYLDKNLSENNFLEAV